MLPEYHMMNVTVFFSLCSNLFFYSSSNVCFYWILLKDSPVETQGISLAFIFPILLEEEREVELKNKII